MGARTARTVSTSGFTSGFSRQHPPTPLPISQHFLQLKYIELKPSSILIHTLQSATVSVDYRKENQLIYVPFVCVRIYTYKHTHAHVFPCPSFESSSPLGQGRASAEARAPNCYWLFLAAGADEITAQNKVTGIFKLQRKSPAGLILL